MLPIVAGGSLSLVQYVGGLVAALVGVLGILLVNAGRNKRALAAARRNARERPPGAVDEPGLVRVRGRVTPVGETAAFESPVAGDPETVLAAWTIEERYDYGTSRSWEDAARGVSSTRFSLDDADLRVDAGERVVGNETDEVVTPAAAAVAAGVGLSDRQCFFESMDVHVETDCGEAPPARLARWLRATDGVSVEPMASAGVDESERRYSEATVRAGDEVCVLGYAADAGAPDGALSLRPSEEHPLYVSTRPFDDLGDGTAELATGALCVVAAIGLAAAVFLVL
ncbi:MAG: hypothetical protein ABEJ80_05275 [Halarchaeum sp.]